MRQATLIFNPRAGRRRDLARLMPALIQTLADHGVHADALETTGPGTAGILAARAASSGSNIVFACGGDGTVHAQADGEWIGSLPFSVSLVPAAISLLMPIAHRVIAYRVKDTPVPLI